jgi:hypothetical protein
VVSLLLGDRRQRPVSRRACAVRGRSLPMSRSLATAT